jgi:hypothetical protein
VLGGVVGGFLLARWLDRQQVADSAKRSDSARRWAPAAEPANSTEEPLKMPSARLGATEEQMDRNMAPPEASPSRAGDVSVAGAAYDFDPRGITPG